MGRTQAGLRESVLSHTHSEDTEIPSSAEVRIKENETQGADLKHRSHSPSAQKRLSRKGSVQNPTGISKRQPHIPDKQHWQ